MIKICVVETGVRCICIRHSIVYRVELFVQHPAVVEIFCIFLWLTVDVSVLCERCQQIDMNIELLKYLQEFVVRPVRDRAHWQLVWTHYAVRTCNR